MRGAPYLALVAATGLALVPIVVLLGYETPPVDPGCIEWCDLRQSLATVAILLVGLLWLLATLTIAWYWEPALATLSAVGASVCLLLGAGIISSIVTFGASNSAGLALLMVIGLGLQLPPVWRLVGRTRPSRAAPIASRVMGGAVLVACVSVIVGGTGTFGWGQQAVSVAFLVFLASLATLANSAWNAAQRRRAGAETIGIGLLGLAALLPLLAVVFSAFLPGGVIATVAIALSILALAWLWLGLTWLRPAPSQPTDDLVLADADA